MACGKKFLAPSHRVTGWLPRTESEAAKGPYLNSCPRSPDAPKYPYTGHMAAHVVHSFQPCGSIMRSGLTRRSRRSACATSVSTSAHLWRICRVSPRSSPLVWPHFFRVSLSKSASVGGCCGSSERIPWWSGVVTRVHFRCGFGRGVV